MGLLEKIKALFGSSSSEPEETEAVEPIVAEDSAEESGDSTNNW
jgi:hypothetical protein